MATAPLRIGIICIAPQIAHAYGLLLRDLGHDPVCVITPRRVRPGTPPLPFSADFLADTPEELDVLFAASRRSLAPLLRAYDLDLGLCTAFPWRISAEAIGIPRLGIVNGHPSLLPHYRGPAPIAWAIRNGEREIGMSYHLMDETLDTGNLLAQKVVPLEDDDTFDSLLARLGPVAAELLPLVLDRVASGDRGDPQEGGDYQSWFEDEYRFVDVRQPAAAVHNQVRAWRFTPPLPDRGAILDRDGRQIRLLSTSLSEVDGGERLDCADGPLWILESEPV